MSPSGAALSVLVFALFLTADAARHSHSHGNKGPNGVEPVRHSAGRYVAKEIVTLVDETEDCVRVKSPIMTLDGGGLRGMIVTEVLIGVEDAIKKELVANPRYRKPDTEYLSPSEFEIYLADYFKAVAGVESGAWIASYLTTRGGAGASEKVFNDKLIIEQYGIIKPGSVEGLRVFFLHYAGKIYPPFTIPFSILPRRYGVEVKIAGVNCPSYPVRGLEATLNLFLGEAYFQDTYGTTLMIHCYDLLTKAAVIFISDHVKRSPNTYTYVLKNADEPRISKQTSVTEIVGKQYFMKDIARASSASPTIYEAKRFSAINDASFEFYAIDGSMMASNPTLMAAYFLTGPDRIQSPHHLAVLSIGTGISTGRYRRHSDSGAWQWMIQTQDFLAIVMDGGSEYVQAQFFTLFYNNLDIEQKASAQESYLRVQSVYDRRTKEGQALEDSHNSEVIKELQKVGFETRKRFKTLIEEHVRKYIVTGCKAPKTMKASSEEEEAIPQFGLVYPGPKEEAKSPGAAPQPQAAPGGKYGAQPPSVGGGGAAQPPVYASSTTSSSVFEQRVIESLSVEHSHRSHNQHHRHRHHHHHGKF